MCVCVVFSFQHKTGLFACLDLVVWFFFVCFFLKFRIFVFIPSKNRSKKRTQQKLKNKYAEKHNFSVSAAVFTNSVPNFGGGLENANFVLTTL